MSTLEEIRTFFAQDRYATQTTGIQIDQARPGYAKCSLTLGPEHQNAVGHVMGGVAFTLADFVFAVATNTQGGPTVTVTSQITYLSSPKGSRLIGESHLLKDGKRQCFYRVDITDDLGTPVAVVNVCGAHLG